MYDLRPSPIGALRVCRQPRALLMVMEPNGPSDAQSRC